MSSVAALSEPPNSLSNRDAQIVHAFELMERAVLLLEQIANPCAPQKALKLKVRHEDVHALLFRVCFVFL